MKKIAYVEQGLGEGLKGELASLGIRYDDDKWFVFRNHTEGGGDRWPMRFESLSPAWKEAIKQTIGHQLVGFDGTRQLASNTMYERFIKMRAFSLWCERRGARDPAEVPALDFGIFVKERLGLGAGCLVHDRPIAAKQVESDMRAVKALYVFGSKDKTVPRGLQQATRLVSQRMRAEQQAATFRTKSRVSEEVILEVMRDAVTFLSTAARPLLDIRDRYIEEYEKIGRELGDLARAQSIHRIVQMRLDQDVAYSRSPGGLVDPLSLKNWEGIRYSISLLLGAAYFVIAFCCALRTSEIRRMQVGSLESRSGPSGPYRVIVGVLSKSGRPHEWVAPPVAVAAFETLVRISEPFRLSTGRDHIVAPEWHRYATTRFKVRGREGRLASIAMMVKQLNGFARHAAEVAGRSPPPWLTFREGRKFLARFVAMRNRNHLAELAMQFGHIDSVVTDTYYVGCDREFVSLLDREVQKEVAAALDDLARPGAVYAVGSKDRSRAIQEAARRSVKAATTERDAKSMLSKGVTLGPCEWGYCLYKQESSRCVGGRMSPSEERRTPAVCVECVNFVATSSHANWWRRRVEDLNRMLQLRGIPQQTTLVLRMRLQQSEAVLEALGAS